MNHFNNQRAMFLSLGVFSLASLLFAQAEDDGLGSFKLEGADGVVEMSKVGGHLGVTVAKPAAGLYAQLPELTRGCGFVLNTVEPESSVSKAGLKPMDVIWKIDGQLLINEGQLAVLLSLYQPGDDVELDYFQSGKLKHVTMKLYPTNVGVQLAKKQAQELPFPVNMNLPMHVISYENKSATISDEHGTATLKNKDGKQWLVIQSIDGQEIVNSEIETSASLSKVPAVWLSKLPLLQSSLRSSASLRKLPRVRRVPTVKPTLAAGDE